jgi:hypothetical protein
MPEPTDPRAALADAEASIYARERQFIYQRAAAVALVSIAEQQQRIADALERRAESAHRPDRAVALITTILGVSLVALLVAALINNIS